MAVFETQRVAMLLLLLGALALAIPAVTLAAGGGSAGDQQYTDPFGGSKTSATSTPAQTTTSSPAPAPTAPSSPASSSSSGSSGDTGSTAAAPASTTPTATAAGTSDSTTAAGTATTLPYTGYDSWMAGVLGLVMLGAGLSLRRRSRRA